MTLQPDPPQDFSQFSPFIDVEKEYNLSEKIIIEAAIKGEIKIYLYNLQMLHFYEKINKDGDKILAYDYSRGFEDVSKETQLMYDLLYQKHFKLTDSTIGGIIKGMNSKRRESIRSKACEKSSDNCIYTSDKSYTKTDLFINIPELEAAFSIINPKTAPPLLALAIQSWTELFSGTFPATGGVTIKSVINEHIAIKYDKKLDQGQISLIVSIISPSDINPAQHIQTDSNLLDKMNKPGHKFYAKELATAVEIWHKIQPGRDERLPNKKALRKELNRLKNKKKSNFSNPAIERIETILTIV